MAAITAAMVGELRAKTDAPMMECKKALTEAAGDMAKAEEILRVKLGSKAGKAAYRVTAEGIVTSFIDGTNGALLEVNCETDFVSKNDDFLAFTKDCVKLVAEKNPADVAALLALPMHIAAMKPVALSMADVPAELIAIERNVAVQKAAESGKPPEIVEKMVEGSVQKYLKEVSLLNQSFVKNDKQTVEQMLKAANTNIKGFTMFVVGEGIEKRQDDFAAEVAAQVAAAKATA